jgi:hypothetical protein
MGEAPIMAKTKTFISFDYDHDEDLKILLAGQAKHKDSPFDIADWSIKEAIDENWKAKARTRIKSADVVVVICGEYTHTAAGVSAEVKIAQQVGTPYFLLKGRSEKVCTKPAAAQSYDKIYDWTWDNLKSLLSV